MNLTAILAEVRTFTADPNDTRWAAAVKTNYVNQGLEAVVKRGRLLEATSTLAPSATASTALLYALPTQTDGTLDVLEIDRLELGGRKLDQLSLSMFDGRVTDWQLDQGQPGGYFRGPWGRGNLRPYPGLPPVWTASTAYVASATVTNGANTYTCLTGGTSASSGGPTGTGSAIADGSAMWAFSAALPTCRLYYFRRPVLLSSGTDVPEIDGAYHMALVYYAVWACYTKNFQQADPQKAATFRGLFEQELAGLVQDHDDVAETIPTRYL